MDGSRTKFNFSFLVEIPSRVNRKTTSAGDYENLEPRYEILYLESICMATLYILEVVFKAGNLRPQHLLIF